MDGLVDGHGKKGAMSEKDLLKYTRHVILEMGDKYPEMKKYFVETSYGDTTMSDGRPAILCDKHGVPHMDKASGNEYQAIVNREMYGESSVDKSWYDGTIYTLSKKYDQKENKMMDTVEEMDTMFHIRRPMANIDGLLSKIDERVKTSYDHMAFDPNEPVFKKEILLEKDDAGNIIGMKATGENIRLTRNEVITRYNNILDGFSNKNREDAQLSYDMIHDDADHIAHHCGIDKKGVVSTIIPGTDYSHISESDVIEYYKQSMTNSRRAFFSDVVTNARSYEKLESVNKLDEDPNKELYTRSKLISDNIKERTKIGWKTNPDKFPDKRGNLTINAFLDVKDVPVNRGHEYDHEFPDDGDAYGDDGYDKY